MEDEKKEKSKSRVTATVYLNSTFKADEVYMPERHVVAGVYTSLLCGGLQEVDGNTSVFHISSEEQKTFKVITADKVVDTGLYEYEELPNGRIRKTTPPVISTIFLIKKLTFLLLSYYN